MTMTTLQNMISVLGR